MTKRMTRNEAWAYFEHPLTSAQTGDKGEMVCLNTATGLLFMSAATTATLRPIGYMDNGEGTTTGDGVKNVRVRLFREIRIHWFSNDTAGTPVVAADIGSLCYLFNKSTVTGSATDNSAAGRVWAVNASLGVAFEPIGFFSA